MGLDRHREAEPSGPPYDVARPFALHRAWHRHAELGGQPQRLPLVERVVEDLGRRRREGGMALEQVAGLAQQDERGLDRRDDERRPGPANDAQQVVDEARRALERWCVAGALDREARVESHAPGARPARDHWNAGEAEAADYREPLVLVGARDQDLGRRAHGAASKSRASSDPVAPVRGPILMPRRALSRMIRRTSYATRWNDTRRLSGSNTA